MYICLLGLGNFTPHQILLVVFEDKLVLYVKKPIDFLVPWHFDLHGWFLNAEDLHWRAFLY